MQLKASAPGSLMLLGEYAVLYGKPALVCAVDKRIAVTLTPRTDETIEIHSASHGHHVTTLSQLTIEKPFHFVLGALKHYQTRLRRGCNIEITSEFSDKVGLGSSAAVTAATLAAIITWLNIKISPIELIRQGRTVIRQVQGTGSGADIAASVFGGIVGYQPQPLMAEKFSTLHPLSVIYAGFKTPTVEAIKQVQQTFSTRPQLFRHLQNGIGQCALDGIQYVRQADWTKLGEIMTIQQGMMESLGVSMPLLRDLIEKLHQQPGMLGAKISGSGLGDCVIGLGELTHVPDSLHHIPVMMTQQGVQCEKI